MPRHPPIALTTLNRSHCQCSSSSWPLQRTGNGPGYLLQPSLINNAIDVFDPVTLLELRRAAHLCQIFKTSFSRSNPVPRGQATVIRCSIRDLFAHARSDFAVRASRERQTIGDGLSPYLSSGQQQNIQSDKLPSYLQSLTNLGPARPSKGSSGKGSDMGKTHTWKPPDQSSLHNFAEQAALHRSDANFYFFKGYLHRHLDTKLYWWS